LKPKLNVLIFTDGACSGNPGPGGWGAIIATPDGEIREMGGADKATTNNRMELTGAIASLHAARKIKGQVDLFTDSTYVIRGITQWIWGWKKNGWKNGEGGEVSNRDLWEDLASVVAERGAKDKINWLYSRGHAGTPGNERCDEIAVGFSKGKWVELYEGPLLKYPVAVYDLPEDTTLPEMKPKTEKKVAYSYLSYLSGEVQRHPDWPSCERRVKGRSGAKFKKAMSAQDEISILTEWGLPADLSRVKSQN
jgi:ribonuclease HI